MTIRTEDIETAIKSLQISPDAYMMWKDNIVTKRFMLEAELELLSRQSDLNFTLSSMETIAIQGIIRIASCERLEDVLMWKPQELQADE